MSTSATLAIQANPFPGLRPFREEEEYLFFGRESQVDAMVDKLATTRFLSVVGTSGSGKSSLVNCGLRPALHGGLMARAGTAWRMAQFRPGSDPLGAMARALAENGVLFRDYQAGGLTLAEIIDTTLRMSKLGLVDIVEHSKLGEDVNLLVVVDQFEELFRYRQLGAAQHEDGFSISEQATAFVNLLLAAKEQTTHRIYVVLTMRSDFLGDCAQFPGLAEAINAGQYLVPRMTRDERRAAISGPVGVGAAKISPVLLTRLVNDVGDNPDQLSILQHALNRTWAYWQNDGAGGGPLDLPDYEAIGTMAHALDHHAEKAYAELGTERQQRICEKVFKALTDKATDPRGIRRPTTLGTLCALVDAAVAEVTEVIDVFRKRSRSFLMPPAGEPLAAETVIDISHESLMRVWRRLDKWAEDEARSAQSYSRLADTAALHAAGKAGLWRDPDLQLALDWRDQSQPNETWAARYHPGYAAAMRFLAESREAREAQRRRKLEAEQEKAEAQARYARRMRNAALLSGALAIVAMIGGVWAFHERDAAQLSARNAREVTRIAVATNSLNRDPTAAGSVLLEIEEVEKLPAAWPLMAEALRVPLSIHILRHPGEIKSAAFSPDGNRLVTASWDNTARVWAADGSGEPVVLIGHNSKLMSAAFSPDGNRVVTASRDNTARVWAADGSGEPVVLTGHKANVNSAAFSPDGRRVVTASEDKTARIWEADGSGEVVVLTGHGSGLTSAEYSPDGSRVVTASRDNTARVQAADGTGEPVVLSGHGDKVNWATFSPDGRRVVTASHDKTARVWAADGSGEPVVLRGHVDAVNSAAFSPDGNRVVTASEDKTARMWAADGSGKVVVLTGHDREVGSAAYSPDGDRVVTASWDRTARVWAANGSGEPVMLTGHNDRVYTAAFSADGSHVVSASRGMTARVWAADGSGEPVLLTGHDREVTAAAFSPDGSRVVTASDDQTARVWAADGSGEPVVLAGHDDKVHSATFSPDGSQVVTASDDRTARVWAADGNGEPVVLTGHDGGVTSATFSSDGSRIVTASLDKTARVWAADGSGEPVVLSGHGGKVNWAAFSPDGRRVVTASGDRARVWAADGSGEPVVLTGHGWAVMSATFSPDGKQVVTASWDNTARIWAAHGRAEPVVLTGHYGRVLSAAFSPDGRRVVTTSRDNTARVWAAHGRAEPVVLAGHDGWVLSAAFNSNSSRVLTASTDGTARVWPVSVSALLEALQATAPACLSPGFQVKFLGELPEEAEKHHQECRKERLAR